AASAPGCLPALRLRLVARERVSRVRAGLAVRVARGDGGLADGAPLHRPELGQGLDGGVGARVLVGVDDDVVALALRHSDGDDLLGEHAGPPGGHGALVGLDRDRKSTRLNSSHVSISYAVFCLKKKKK